MPNIELHGYEPVAADTVRERIRDVLMTSPDASEIVTTTIPSDVKDLDGEKMPFLRLITSLRELPDLKERLKPLGEEIEVLVLGEWIPKPKEE